ncbi:HNH endonuclease [Pseudomonas putida]|nr:HNH endonuclease [Pseudomonas putida]
MSEATQSLRLCLRLPVPEIFDAARYLDAAVSAHISANRALAEELIRAADMPEVRQWTESLWGKASPYVRKQDVPGAPPVLAKKLRIQVRMPTAAEKKILHQRDGFHCRFCQVPVIRSEVRTFLKRYYPSSLPWGGANRDQHAAFQALWAQYDHVLAHARGGDNSVQNTIVTCAPCNFGKMNYTLEELGLTDPRDREPVISTWDGLERLLTYTTAIR